jgi:CRISPR-associated endonuclease/helicase Cas3
VAYLGHLVTTKWDHALLNLWGKSGDDAGNRIFHPLAFHVLDVAACAEAWLRENPHWLARLAGRFEVNSEGLQNVVVALIALHDIGKCARGFQGKRLDLWPDILGARPEVELSVRHDAAGLWLIDKVTGLSTIAARMLPELSPSCRDLVVQATCCHHGEPIAATEIRNPRRDIGRESQEVAGALAEAVLGLFDRAPSCPIADKHAPLFSFALSGLTVLSDWLGSNRTWFEYRSLTDAADLAAYWNGFARPSAETALRESGLLPARPARGRGIGDLFPAIREPTELQRFAAEVAFDDGPRLFVIEDMTGAGKTEAAALLAYRLIEAGKARGLYVALPTMATANAMFDRLETSYLGMFESAPKPSIVLVHGKRRLVEGFENLPGSLARNDEGGSEEDDPSSTTASAFCADWIRRSAKQAFLAQVGAGTIDQALLAVLPARHQSLRLHGLTDKVLIVDEAHAYDSYMGEEIETLLRFHAALGGSAIVLSATLPAERRTKLVRAFRQGVEGPTWTASAMAYPLVTSVSRDDASETPLALRKGLEREVDVERIGSVEEMHAIALTAARAGAAVAVVRNTVDEAIASRNALAAEFCDVVLFHARFAMCDRSRIEEDVVGRFGKHGNGKRNCILVATQVVEQSLDLDFDVMLTDLAPVDLSIQRAGRLWRHERLPRPGGDRPILHVFSPEPPEDADARWLTGVQPGTCGVYRDAALLWRSARALFSAGKIVSKTSTGLRPIERGEVRALVEAVYGEGKLEIPAGLEAAENEAEGKKGAEKTWAQQNVLKLDEGYARTRAWDSDTKVQTRIGQETITLRLAKVVEGRIVPWAGMDQDMRRAWALSEVSVRKALCERAINPQGLHQAIEVAQKGWTLSEREIPILVLEKADRATYKGSGIDSKKVQKDLFYSSAEGLRVSS